MFKKILLCGFAVLLLCLTGCVSGSAYASVADIKQKMSEKHPVVNVLTPLQYKESICLLYTSDAADE